jgi:hypothetical protein
MKIHGELSAGLRATMKALCGQCAEDVVGIERQPFFVPKPAQNLSRVSGPEIMNEPIVQTKTSTAPPVPHVMIDQVEKLDLKGVYQEVAAAKGVPDNVRAAKLDLACRQDACTTVALVPRVEPAVAISAAFASAKAAMDPAMRKVILCGLLMLEQKARLKHGQFDPWLKTNCPEIPERTARMYRDIAEAAVCITLEKKSFVQIGNDCRFGANFPISKLLQLSAGELPKPVAEIQSRLFELVDGKSQKQLLFDFKDPDARRGGDRTPRNKHGKRIQKAWGSKEPTPEDINSQAGLIIMDLAWLRGEKGKWISMLSEENFRALEFERVALTSVMSEIGKVRKKKAKG